MSKVVIISGSPRKGGNSETLDAEFARGAVEAGHEVEVVRLASLKIGNCRACYACRNTGCCVQKDDGEIYGESAWERGEVDGTPATREAYEAGRSC